MADMPGMVEDLPRRPTLQSRLARVPWWLIIVAIAGIVVILAMLQNASYSRALTYLVQGVGTTVYISVVAYAIALVVGLIAGLGRVSRNPVIYTIATLYVEVMRGLPMLVIILYMQFVLAPQLGFARNAQVSGILGLAIGYGAYLAEVYRSGIESLDRGQAEASRSLGMTPAQTMRHVILPQAIRRVLPPLGNDFIAMLKDSSLLSAIAVSELTQLARIEGSRTFNFFLAFNAAAVLYLALTLLLSLGVRWIERVANPARR